MQWLLYSACPSRPGYVVLPDTNWIKTTSSVEGQSVGAAAAEAQCNADPSCVAWNNFAYWVRSGVRSYFRYPGLCTYVKSGSWGNGVCSCQQPTYTLGSSQLNVGYAQGQQASGGGLRTAPRDGIAFRSPSSLDVQEAGGVSSADADESFTLYLVAFQRGSVQSLRRDLGAGGVTVVDYVPDDLLIVLGSRGAVMQAAQRNQALVAPYNPELRVSPEAAAAVQATQPARRRRDQRRRRALASLNLDQKGSGGAEDGDSVEYEGADTAYGDQQALRNVPTWKSHGAREWRHNLLIATAAAANSGPNFSHMRRLMPATAAVDAPGAPTLYAFDAALVLGLDAAQVQEVKGQWPLDLAAALGRADAETDPCWPRAITHGVAGGTATPTLRVYVCAEDVPDSIAWLSSRPTVTWVWPATKHTPTNAYAGWILQTGDITDAQAANPTAEVRPYWAAGLQGQNIIVGVGDTGLDLGHCSFLDPVYTPASLKALLQRNTSVPGSPLRWYLPQHRKVVQYVIHPEADESYFGDYAKGHGTHVCGSIAGGTAPTASGSAAAVDVQTGGAPLARLSFYDLSKGEGDFVIPWPVDTQLLPYHLSAGAYQSSDSWGPAGSVAVLYDRECVGYDAFLWSHPEFISAVANGNDGENAMMGTAASPANAKVSACRLNVLAVGASHNAHPNNNESPEDGLLFRFEDSLGSTQQVAVFPDGEGRGLSRYNAFQDIATQGPISIVLASPNVSACSPLSTAVTWAGKIVLIDLGAAGTCSLATRVANVQARGAAGLLMSLYANGNSPDLRPKEDSRFDPDSVTTTLALARLPRVQGQWMMSALKTAGNRNARLQYIGDYAAEGYNVGIESVASFSSIGPTLDGRIKPDVVAPGYWVESAKAKKYASSSLATPDTCGTGAYLMAGTSMATPLVSGHVALVRQYFREGFYPSGAKTGVTHSAPFDPSGMLIKALVIGGAKSLQGGFALGAGNPLRAGPDGYQGWGRLNLAGTLPLRDVSGAAFRVQVADMGTIQQGQQVVLAGLKATGTGPVYATLVWYDFPAPQNAKKTLINDLDLSYSINEDSVNTVERAELTDLDDGARLSFTVNGTSINHQLMDSAPGRDTHLPQRWALAVVGHFTGLLQTHLNPAFVRPQYIANIETTTSTSVLLSPLSSSGGLCVYAQGGSVSLSSTCTLPDTGNTLVLEPDVAADEAPFYRIRNSGGACLTFGSATTGAVAGFSACIIGGGSDGQRFGFFQADNAVTSYQVVPKLALGVGDSSTRRCVAPAAPAAAGKALILAACSEDDDNQLFQVWVSPDAMSITLSWAPDSATGSSGSDDADLYNLNLYVRWINAAGVLKQLGYASRTEENGDGRYTGDNIEKVRNSESVVWPAATQPDAATYEVCAEPAASFMAGPTLTLTLTVRWLGEVAFTHSTTFDTMQQYACEEGWPGYEQDLALQQVQAAGGSGGSMQQADAGTGTVAPDTSSNSSGGAAPSTAVSNSAGSSASHQSPSVSTIVAAAVGGVVGVAVLALAVLGVVRWRRAVLSQRARVTPMPVLAGGGNSGRDSVI
ncbi:hypothetical protein HXX76_014329 [Chlamydomonas incerta]|uniref:Peptidase S8/S53 domain-containing protein n=1 Tax=Chlamydomonas incerta TaxID=51695 RepID=A0A835VSW6_CHLIN|nr:hypothetical protein HXX76_014329 [Chlamydomonas incerta]|eukprot:KAG2424603.1 hypothetical protein HXX76_014329 [Chlamydomonas incerta]